MTTQQIPYEKGLPLLGVSLSLAGNPEAALRKMYEKHGSIFQFKAAHFHYVCMAGQEANEFINTEGKDFFTTRSFWEPLANYLNSPNAVTVLDGAPHKIVRSSLKNPLSRKVVEENIPDVVKIIKNNFDHYQNGEEFAFVYASQKLSSNIVGHLLMEKIPTDEELKYFFKYANTLTIVLSVLRLPAAALFFQGVGFYKAKRATKALINSAMENAITKRHPRKLLVEYMLEASKEHPELFTEGDIRSSGFLAFFAGIDTMGQTLAFMLWELVKNPEAMREVQQEIDSVMEETNNLLAPNDLQNKMPLCRAAFMEALRLHPTAFGIVRSAACDFTFKGYPVKKGQDILLYTTLTHHQPEYFPNPEKFDIHRYIEPRFEHRQRGVYTPFGRGHHTCAGAAWSEAQAILMLATLLRHYQFEMSESMKSLVKKMGTTPTLGEKFKVSIRARNY